MSETVSVTRRLEWDAMHRLAGHEGVCRAVHGHRYAAEITCTAPTLDKLGRVIDFAVIKNEVGAWIEHNFDHTAILQADDPDPVAAAIVATNERVGKPAYLLQAPPTVENIAIELARQSQRLLEPHGIAVTEVKVWETPNCWASWKADDSTS